MEPAGLVDSTIKFGVFEVDPRSGELRKSGSRIRLQDQPFKVLLTLLEHPGEVVTREELRRRIWPTESFGDFDHAVNVAVAKLRTALGDSPDHPRYVETLHRRGYRFVFPVASASKQQTGIPAQSVAMPGDGTEKQLPQDRMTGGVRGRAAMSNLKAWLWACVVILAIGAAGSWFFHRTPKLTERDTIVLADFTNSTGDPVFDGTLRQGLSVQLEQSPFLSLLPEERIQQTLRMMKQPADAELKPETAREICQRTGSTIVLDGSIGQIGAQYSLILRAVNCSNGESLASTEAQASDKNHVLEALGKSCTDIRRKLGESLATIQKFDTPLEEATTSSLEALQALTHGRERIRRGQEVEGINYLNRAVELDPNLAVAYVTMAAAYGNLNEETRSMESMQKAYALRDRVGERERLYIDMIYHWIVTGDRDKELESQKLFSQIYPREISPLNNLALNYSQYFGEYEKGIEAGNQVLRLSPYSAGAYIAIGTGYLGLKRVRDAKRVFERGQAQTPGGLGHNWLFMTAYLEGDQAGMLRERKWAAGNVEASGLPGVYAASAAAQQGKIKESRELMMEGAETARAHSYKDLSSSYIAGQALTEAEVGNLPKAREYAAASMKLSRTRTNLPTLAVALALAGDGAGAQRILNDLNHRFPEDTWINFIYGPCARAATRGTDPAEVIAGLQAAYRYELGFYNRLLPIYFRALTYLRAGEATLAAAEFQRLIDHRGSSPVAPEYALAYLGLARAYLLAGDSTKGHKAYQDFFALWKDADPDIPILKQAKNEYAKLQ